MLAVFVILFPKGKKQPTALNFEVAYTPTDTNPYPDLFKIRKYTCIDITLNTMYGAMTPFV